MTITRRMIKRRKLLQIAGVSFAASPLGNLLASTPIEADFQLLVIRDSCALPLFAEGDVLLLDTLKTRYSGDGIYLYPHWGAPRPYQINLVGSAGQTPMLEFRNPGNQQLLWSQSHALDSRFAGKLQERFFRFDVAGNAQAYPLLRLPALPADNTRPAFVLNVAEMM